MALLSSWKQGRQRISTAEARSRGSVQVGNDSVFYEAAGSGERGPALLLLHDSGGTASTWTAQLEGLAQGARCLAPDLPGHGRSSGLGRNTVGQYREVILDFLDALAIRWPVVVAGVCLGAAVAVDIALHAPDRVTGLILTGVTEGGRACEHIRSAVARGEATEAFVHQLFGPQAPQRLVKERLRAWRQSNPVVRHHDLAAVAAYPMLESLRLVGHPTLLVAGMQDPGAPSVAAEAMSRLRHACLESLPGAGCLAMLEEPDAFNRAAGQFLEGMQVDWTIASAEQASAGYRRR